MLEQPHPADGKALYFHLVSGERQSGVKNPLLDIPEMPSEVSYVWEWFKELSAERGRDLNGNPEPITSEKLACWSGLRRMHFTAFELGALAQLDSLFLSKRYEKEESDD